MQRFLIQRLTESLLVLFLSSVAVFFIIRLLPGDPATVLAGPDASDAALAALRDRLGLDQSLPVQYWEWGRNLLAGNFGNSFISGVSVVDLIANRAPATLLLGVAASIIAAVLGVGLGTLASLRPNGLLDRIISTFSATVIAIPSFWLGILLIGFFAVGLGLLPSGGYVSPQASPADALLHLLLPTVALASNSVAIVARFTRTAILEVSREDYIRTAISKGASGARIVVHHLLRNALIPIVTVFGIVLGNALGGAIVVETVFNWPGLGLLLIQTIGNRDYAVLQGLLIVLVLIFLVINLVVDLVYGLLDPRVRVGGH